MARPSTTRKLKSVAEIAAYLGTSQRTVRRYIADGVLPAYRVAGRLVRVDQADAETLVRQIPTAGDAA